MSEPTIRWGRGLKGGVIPPGGRAHRVQHAWRVISATHRAIPVCLGPDNRFIDSIDFDSDAARCERCAAHMARGAA